MGAPLAVLKVPREPKACWKCIGKKEIEREVDLASDINGVPNFLRCMLQVPTAALVRKSKDI